MTPEEAIAKRETIKANLVDINSRLISLQIRMTLLVACVPDKERTFKVESNMQEVNKCIDASKRLVDLHESLEGFIR